MGIKALPSKNHLQRASPFPQWSIHRWSSFMFLAKQRLRKKVHQSLNSSLEVIKQTIQFACFFFMYWQVGAVIRLHLNNAIHRRNNWLINKLDSILCWGPCWIHKVHSFIVWGISFFSFFNLFFIRFFFFPSLT